MFAGTSRMTLKGIRLPVDLLSVSFMGQDIVESTVTTIIPRFNYPSRQLSALSF